MDSETLARQVIETLRRAGHQAYLVGGCVRDLLLGRKPEDFDVATDARPDRIMDLFPRSGRVGAHFGVVLVRDVFSQVEVATFRSDHDYTDGRRPARSISRRNPSQDVLRRDFTINGLMMDPDSGEVLDFVGGRAGPGAPRGPRHRRPRRAVPRGPPAPAARRPLRRPPRFHNRPRHIRGHPPPAFRCPAGFGRAGPRRAGPHPHRGRCAARLRNAGCERLAGLHICPKSPP